MIISKDNIDDIRKYYLKTYVKFKETGDRIFFISEINTDSVYCEDAFGFTVKIDLNEPYEINYPLPSRAVYQHGKFAACLVRRPARQYYRGIHVNNTNCAALQGNGIWTSLDITSELLQKFVDKPCYQNLNNLDKACKSWAISPNFSICESGIIYCIFRRVGTIDFTNKIINIHTLLKEEFTPLVPNDYILI